MGPKRASAPAPKPPANPSPTMTMAKFIVGKSWGEAGGGDWKHADYFVAALGGSPP